LSTTSRRFSRRLPVADLKPCPFCATEPVTAGRTVTALSRVECPECFASRTADRLEDAVARWNRRPIEDALTADRDRLAARVAELEGELERVRDQFEEYVRRASDGN
jgi:hypothetical protein